MNHPLRIQIRLISAAVLGLLLAPSVLQAQENHVLAIGQINSLGNVVNSADTLTGTAVSSSKTGTGDFTITLNAPGAFAGNGPTDFLVEMTVEGSVSTNDDVPQATIASVNPNQLEVDVNINDVEDPSSPTLGEARDRSFFFAIYRIPTTFPANGATKFVLALGKVDTDGDLLSGLGVGGVAVSSVRNATGDFDVTLTKSGAFVGDNVDDYVVILSVEDAASNHQDQVIAGDTTSTGSDDQVVVKVRTADVQTDLNDDTVSPANTEFFFTIYRIPSGPGTGIADSKLLVAMATVDGSTGNLIAGGQAFDGSPLASVRDATGEYRVTITSPGAFAGKSADQYVLQLHLNESGVDDEFIHGIVSLPDANTLRIDVSVQDLESTLDVGQVFDRDFFLLVYDTEAMFQPDLRVGRRGRLSSHKGDDRYNRGGAVQRIRVLLRGTRNGKYFLSLENDGNLIDDIFLKAKRSGNKIKTKYFRLTGGRKNVTAAITSKNLTIEGVPPSKIIKFRVKAKYKKPNRRPKKTLRYLARSEMLASQRDANKATLKAR